MRLFAVPRREIGAFGSHGVLMDFLPRVDRAGGTSVHVATMSAGGTLGRHPAVTDQVFAVLSGRVQVAGDDGVRHDLEPGRFAVWSPGEQHQSWAVTDAVVVIVETDGELTFGDAFRPL